MLVFYVAEILHFFFVTHIYPMSFWVGHTALTYWLSGSAKT